MMLVIPIFMFIPKKLPLVLKYDILVYFDELVLPCSGKVPVFLFQVLSYFFHVFGVFLDFFE